ncbi:MAG: tRNA (N6-threonylcarbamoyladenosine(37)-N6)-methyltransferase TrmO, partial [Deltaproteobacteria bacterium]|nr:tRNA (N6-threonylcarbamoyladenosine(37)-N6)-methyltransferase TrmO [Deltaproteobacteria bacterium]
MNCALPITLTPVGVMHCRLLSLDDTPKNFDESDQTGTLEIFSQYEEALEGIEAGQTLVVLFWLHQARRDVLKVYPRGDRSRGLHGVFSTRSPMRPNPIALSELKVLEIRGNMLSVVGVDVIDGTPLLDIKKKLR